MSSCELFTGKSKCERIIEKEKMVNVMTDIYLLESYIQVTYRTRPDIRDSIEYYYAALFNKHNITKETFDKAFECYSLDRDLMFSLNESVLNEISIIEARKEEDEPESEKHFPEKLTPDTE